jgi:DNA-binding NtrC family response regulator
MTKVMTEDPPISVLIVDDDMLVRWSLASILTDHGCTVSEREDARSAARAVEASPGVFDVILLDHRLPDTDGLQLLPRLKALAPDSKVVMMSAHMSGEEIDEAMRLGACAFVSKPFDLEDMWIQIQQQRPDWR